MGAIVIVIIIVAAFILGHFYIRKQRKAMLEERALKLKVAEGGREQKPAKKKKRKKRWFKSSNKWDLPEFLLQDIYKDVPVMTEALLQAKHAVNAGYAASAKASAHRASAVGRLEAMTLPPRGSINIERWLQHVLDIAAEAQKSIRAEREAQVAYTVAIVKHGDAVGDLSGFLTGLDKFDLEELDDDALRNLEIARTATNECKYSPERPELVDVRPEPEAPNQQFDAVLDQLFEHCGKLAISGIELSRAVSISQEAFRNCDALSKDPELPELEKPNDVEVVAWLTAALDWAACRQESEQSFCGSLPAFGEALASANAATVQVREALKRCDELESQLIAAEKAKREAERSTGWGWRSSWDRSFESNENTTPVESDAAPVVQKVEPRPRPIQRTVGRRNRAADFSLFGGEHESFNFRRGRRKKEDWAPRKESPALLSDAQVSRKNAALRVLALVEGTLSAQESTFESYSKKSVTLVSQTSSEDEARLAAQLKATIRKLGFAAAQHASAQAKLKDLRDDASASNAAAAVTLDETTVDAYIRAHRIWLDGGTKVEAAARQRQERVSQLTEQVAEREQQLADCVTALVAMTPPAPAPQASICADLAVTVSAAQLLARKHKVSPAATPAPTPSSTSSSAQDRKKKNKRRRR